MVFRQTNERPNSPWLPGWQVVSELESGMIKAEAEVAYATNQEAQTRVASLWQICATSRWAGLPPGGGRVAGLGGHLQVGARGHWDAIQ